MCMPSLARASVLALLLVGCSVTGDGATRSQSASGRPSATVDTVGDTVVVRSAVTGGAPRLRLVPDLRIGVAEGDERYVFGQIGLVRAAAHGGVLVSDRLVGNVREYASDGTFRRNIGRTGGGPGEFRGITGLVVLEDGRILLLDGLQHRINVYDSTGAALTSWPVDTRMVTRDGLFADTVGSVYVQDFLEDYDPDHRTRREGLVRLSSTTGGVLDTIPLPDMPEAPFVSAAPPGYPPGSAVMNVVPFSAVGTWDLGPDGVLVSGTGATYAVTVHRVGAPQLRIERAVAAVPVTRPERAVAESTVTARMRRVNPSWRWNGPEVPRTKPFFRTVRVARNGRIWLLRELAVVQDTEPEGGRSGGPGTPVAGRALDIFEADGSFIGAAALPPRTEILAMDRHVLWGVERDSVGIPFLVRFRVLGLE